MRELELIQHLLSEMSQTQLKKLHEETEIPVQKLHRQNNYGKWRDHKSNQRQEKHKQTVINVVTNISLDSALHMAKPVTKRITLRCA